RETTNGCSTRPARRSAPGRRRTSGDAAASTHKETGMNIKAGSSRTSVALAFGVAVCVLAGASIALAQTPAKADVDSALKTAYDKYKTLQEGKNADYIPALAKVDSKIYGIALVGVDGSVRTAGDITSEVSIQSISKVFTLAKVIEEQGPAAIAKTIGVDATG